MVNCFRKAWPCQDRQEAIKEPAKKLSEETSSTSSSNSSIISDD